MPRPSADASRFQLPGDGSEVVAQNLSSHSPGWGRGRAFLRLSGSWGVLAASSELVVLQHLDPISEHSAGRDRSLGARAGARSAAAGTPSRLPRAGLPDTKGLLLPCLRGGRCLQPHHAAGGFPSAVFGEKPGSGADPHPSEEPCGAPHPRSLGAHRGQERVPRWPREMRCTPKTVIPTGAGEWLWWHRAPGRLCAGTVPQAHAVSRPVARRAPEQPVLVHHRQAGRINLSPASRAQGLQSQGGSQIPPKSLPPGAPKLRVRA